MVAIARSACLDGFAAIPVEVQADASSGIPAFNIVGLTDKAVQEARERVRAAIRNSRLKFPEQRVTVNLAPAEQRKEGSAFDLAIALAVLGASGHELELKGAAFVGELGLDGTVRRTRGVLPMCLRLAAEGLGPVFVPAEDAAEALASGAEVLAVESLPQVVDHLLHRSRLHPPSAVATTPAGPPCPDLAEIEGQVAPKRALEIAAAGGHHLLLSGPPGAGKSMLARALAGLLPDLDAEASREVTAIHSIAGLMPTPGMMVRPPLRSPHHTVSIAGMVGGRRWNVPGELCLAHRGVLVLDELPEFSRNCLEALREPLEEGIVRLGRASGTRLLPASFILAATANPCPCGKATGRSNDACTCTPEVVNQYQKKISGPLRDRIDLVLEVRPVQLSRLPGRRDGETTAVVAQRVLAARRLQSRRQGRQLNASLPGSRLGDVCSLEPEAARLVPRLAADCDLTARGFHGVFRLARTIADLAGRPRVSAADLLEASELRGG